MGFFLTGFILPFGLLLDGMGFILPRTARTTAFDTGLLYQETGFERGDLATHPVQLSVCGLSRFPLALHFHQDLRGLPQRQPAKSALKNGVRRLG